jgi:hypothetical protein
MKLRQISKREFLKKWIICLIFSVELFVLVWLTEIMSNIISTLSLGLNSGIFWLGMSVTEFFFLIVFGFVPIALLAMWLINPAIVNGILAQFQLTEKSLDKKNTGKGDNPNIVPSHDQVRITILTLLYKKAEKNPKDSSVGKNEINEVLNVGKNIIDFNLIYLEQEKLIESVLLFDNSQRTEPRRITSSGINVIEHKDENKNRLPFLTAKIPIQIQNKVALVNIG